MFPKVEITIDGNPVAGAFYERLVDLTITDKTGVKSDTIDIQLNDGPPDFLAIPRTGALIDARLGYDQVRSLGQFVVDKVTCKFLPFSMQIGGKSANLRAGKLKERQERHWDKIKLKAVISQIASESGLTPAVDTELGDFEYEWLGQQDESNIHFLHRLEDRHNGLFAVKDKRLIFAKRGSALSASGAFVGSCTITPDMIVRGSGSVEFNDRTKYSKVVAYYQDNDKAKRVEIDADGDEDGDSVYRIPEPYASVSEADTAAQSKVKKLKRGKGDVSVTLIGDTSIAAGAPLLFQGVRPGLDGVPYVIETATHKYSKTGGYTTAVSAKLYDGYSAKKKASSFDDTKADDGKVAPNAPSGTPATPPDWVKYQRIGLTDLN